MQETKGTKWIFINPSDPPTKSSFPRKREQRKIGPPEYSNRDWKKRRKRNWRREGMRERENEPVRSLRPHKIQYQTSQKSFPASLTFSYSFYSTRFSYLFPSNFVRRERGMMPSLSLSLSRLVHFWVFRRKQPTICIIRQSLVAPNRNFWQNSGSLRSSKALLGVVGEDTLKSLSFPILVLFSISQEPPYSFVRISLQDDCTNRKKWVYRIALSLLPPGLKCLYIQSPGRTLALTFAKDRGSDISSAWDCYVCV